MADFPAMWLITGGYWRDVPWNSETSPFYTGLHPPETTKKMPPNKDPLAWLTPVPPHRLGLLSHGEGWETRWNAMLQNSGITGITGNLEEKIHWRFFPAWNNAAGPSLGRNSRFSNWIWKSPGGTFTTDHVMFIIIFHVKTYCGWKKSCTSW